jgi:hypothetical protein
MLFRRFGYLQARILLEKQDDLRRLESDLNLMDNDDIDEGRGRYLKTRVYNDSDCMKPHQELMKKIEAKWLEYCQ